MDQEALNAYLDGVLEDIAEARADPANWKLNETYHAQLELSMKSETGE